MSSTLAWPPLRVFYWTLWRMYCVRSVCHTPIQHTASLKTKLRLLWRPSSYRAVNTFYLGYKNQSVYAVSGTSRCLFSDKYKTHKNSVGRAYSCWMLNCWRITRPVGFKRLTYYTKILWRHVHFSLSMFLMLCTALFRTLHLLTQVK